MILTSGGQSSSGGKRPGVGVLDDDEKSEFNCGGGVGSTFDGGLGSPDKRIGCSSSIGSPSLIK